MKNLMKLKIRYILPLLVFLIMLIGYGLEKGLENVEFMQSCDVLGCWGPGIVLFIFPIIPVAAVCYATIGNFTNLCAVANDDYSTKAVYILLYILTYYTIGLMLDFLLNLRKKGHIKFL